MEWLIQLLDDLDDLIGAIGLVRERIRGLLLACLFACAALGVQVSGVVLALNHPPLALATAMLMFVTLLYRFATSPHHAVRAAAPGGDQTPLELA